MRSALTLGRFIFRQSFFRGQQASRLHSLQRASFRTYSRYGGLPRKGHSTLLAAVGLSPAVFVQLSEKENDGPADTAEGRMLEASRDELEKKLSDDDQGFSRARHAVVLFLDVYIWEPLCTGIRFLQLVFIFVPVIVTVPVVWFGRRDKTRDNERRGTLWWYNFMVGSMERAGPAFIKVRMLHEAHINTDIV